MKKKILKKISLIIPNENYNNIDMNTKKNKNKLYLTYNVNYIGILSKEDILYYNNDEKELKKIKFPSQTSIYVNNILVHQSVFYEKNIRSHSGFLEIDIKKIKLKSDSKINISVIVHNQGQYSICSCPEKKTGFEYGFHLNAWYGINYDDQEETENNKELDKNRIKESIKDNDEISYLDSDNYEFIDDNNNIIIVAEEVKYTSLNGVKPLKY